MDWLMDIFGSVAGTALDVLPIAVLLMGFQIILIGGLPPAWRKLIVGFVLVVLGLGLFMTGLEQALFPLGRLMAAQLTDPQFLGITGIDDAVVQWDAYYWVYIFAFMIGFSTTIAEPALLAVAIKANEESGGAIGVWGLRIAVAIGAATGVALGCYRIVTGTPLHYYIMAGYFVVVIQTALSPRMIVPLAYDSGGVTTSTVTVPIITALGLGLAEAIPGRSPLLDGFGLVAFTCLFPIISVLAYAQFSALATGLGNRRAGQWSK